MGRPPTPPEQRFWQYVEKTDDCWLWTGGCSDNGYGNFRGANSRQIGAHVFSYELENGPVPDDQMLDHRCRRSACVRPSHLRVVPNKKNQEHRDGPNRDNNSSGVLGVHRYVDRDRYRVVVRHNGKIHYGGSFPLDKLDQAEAAAVTLRNRLFTHNDSDRTPECLDAVVPDMSENR